MLCGSAGADTIAELRPVINETAQKHQLDPVLMEAIMRHESANGKSKAAANYNNLAGIMGKKGLKKFQTKEECIAYLGVILKAYHDRGLVSVDNISRRYAPYHRKSWASKVGIFSRQIKNGKWGDI